MKSFNHIRVAEARASISVGSADNKPENFRDANGKIKVRMVPVKKTVVQYEAVDYEKLTQLARYGLVDKSNVNKLIAAFKKMEDGKVLAPQQRELMLSVLTDLTGIVTGDSQMFQKAKKAVKEGTLEEAINHINLIGEAMKQKLFMFKTKAEAEAHAKKHGGKVVSYTPTNHAVLDKDLTKKPGKKPDGMVKESELDEKYDTPVKKKPVSMMSKAEKDKNDERRKAYKDHQKSLRKEETQIDEARPSQRHPLEGHPYHKKTNAELEYIGKDAHKAAKAMKSHNPSAEGKYLDQANDSATVRHFRKTSGTPDWYKKKYGHSMKEEVQIDEAHPAQQISVYNPDSKTYRGSSNRIPNSKSTSVSDIITKGKRVNFPSGSYEPDPLAGIKKEQMEKLIKDALAALTEKEATILKARFGIKPFTKEMNLVQIGKVIDVTTERVRQIEAKALRKLKNPKRSGNLRHMLKSYAEDTQIDEISMTKMAAYAPKAVKSRNDAKAATHSADSNRVANAKKVIAKRKAGADNYNKKMWGYGNVAPTKESLDEMGAFMSSPLPTPMSMRKEPSMTKPLMLTKKMNTAATLIKKAGNTPVSPRTEATYSDTGWQKPEVKKDKFGNVIKTKNVAKTLAKSGLRQTKDMADSKK